MKKLKTSTNDVDRSELTKKEFCQRGVCKTAEAVILNAKVQVGEVRPTLGSSDARWSRSLDDVPSPGSKEHWFKEV